MKTRLNKLSLITTVLVMSFLAVQPAQAKIRVRVNVRTPQVNLQVHSGRVNNHRVAVQRVPMSARHHCHHDITKQDRKIAKRLAKYAHVSKRELINLRNQGYRWSEIGRWLDLPRGAVYAAKDSRSWKRFLRHEQRSYRGYRGHGSTSCKHH